MPHSLPHIITQIRASGRTTTHGAILLAEVDRLRALVDSLTVDDADADPQVAAMVNASGHTIDDSALILTELNRIGWTVRPITGLLAHEADGCCHKTRLRDAPCPVGRECPFIKETANAPAGIVSPSFKGAQAAVKREQSPLREALRRPAQKIADGLNDAIEGRYRTVTQETANV